MPCGAWVLKLQTRRQTVNRKSVWQIDKRTDRHAASRQTDLKWRVVSTAQRATHIFSLSVCQICSRCRCMLYHTACMPLPSPLSFCGLFLLLLVLPFPIALALPLLNYHRRGSERNSSIPLVQLILFTAAAAVAVVFSRSICRSVAFFCLKIYGAHKT